LRVVVLATAAVLLHLAASASAETNSPVDPSEFFEAKIRPLLIERCEECHGPKKQKGGLRLDSKAGWQTGGDTGAALKPGDPEASLLIKAVRYGDKDLQMPPKRQLAPEEVAALEQWIKLGAPDPRVEPKSPVWISRRGGGTGLFSRSPIRRRRCCRRITGASRRSIASSWRGCARRVWNRAGRRTGAR
jgi:hypothetical protein